ncbi:MAG: ribosome-associated translation inhibitor RaiA [Nitrospiraceae bacterium]|nr:ribosome-associated translation inhibitor RaiA [Nitrospiraceae bacterium]
MNIVTTARHLELTPALKNYAEEKVGKFDRYLSNITEAKITLTLEKNVHKAEILLNVNGMLILAEGSTGDIYSAIDEVVDKLDIQVQKYKGKLTSHRKGENNKTTPPAGPPAEGASPEEGGRIIKMKRFGVKPMTPEEASLQMDLLDKSFFVFTDAASGALNIIYRRNDGNYGLIEPVK